MDAPTAKQKAKTSESWPSDVDDDTLTRYDGKKAQ